MGNTTFTGVEFLKASAANDTFIVIKSAPDEIITEGNFGKLIDIFKLIAFLKSDKNYIHKDKLLNYYQVVKIPEDSIVKKKNNFFHSSKFVPRETKKISDFAHFILNDKKSCDTTLFAVKVDREYINFIHDDINLRYCLDNYPKAVIALINKCDDGGPVEDVCLRFDPNALRKFKNHTFDICSKYISHFPLGVRFIDMERVIIDQNCIAIGITNKKIFVNWFVNYAIDVSYSQGRHDGQYWANDGLPNAGQISFHRPYRDKWTQCNCKNSNCIRD